MDYNRDEYYHGLASTQIPTKIANAITMVKETYQNALYKGKPERHPNEEQDVTVLTKAAMD